jgi:PAT family beta-lactamase induction signal transducer AmpG
MVNSKRKIMAKGAMCTDVQSVGGSPESCEKHSIWSYVIGLYMPFGIMSGMLTQFPVAMFKLLGFSNQTVGLMANLGLIASLRFLYAPWLDGATSKRTLALFTLGGGTVLLGGMSILLFSQWAGAGFVMVMGALLCLFALLIAAHETASDGYYIRALDASQQAQFIGIKTACIRGGTLTVSMCLLLGATKLASHYGAVTVDSPDKSGFYIGFAYAYALAGVLVLAFLLWNRSKMPVLKVDQAVKHTHFAIREVICDYFRQPGVRHIVLLILFYRFGEGFLCMKQPFYIDSIETGGLGATAATLPLYTVLTDTPWNIAGGILGGYIIKWYGIQKTFKPMALLMSLPNLGYVLLALLQPAAQITLLGEEMNLWAIVVSCLESFGYGISFSALFYYMHIMATESGRNKTSILAFSLVLLNIGMFVPGMLSGIVQAAIGYTGTFIISGTIGLVVLFIIPHLPMPESKQCCEHTG